MERIVSHAAPTVLECDRLQLRAFQGGEGRALSGLVQSNRERLLESFPNSVAQLIDEAAGERWILSKSAEWEAKTGFWYGVWERGTLRLIGQIQIKNVDWGIGRAEVAYLLDGESEGKGLMTEALRKVLETCFRGIGLKKVFLRTVVGNERSEQLAARFKFKHEGTLRREFLTGSGDLVDIKYFGLLAEEAP